MNRRNPPVTCGDIFLAGDGNPFVREADISPDRGIAFDKGDKTPAAILRNRSETHTTRGVRV